MRITADILGFVFFKAFLHLCVSREMVTACYNVRQVLWIQIQLNDLYHVEYYGSESETQLISWYTSLGMKKNLLQMDLRSY
jgi:hypothetical protein